MPRGRPETAGMRISIEATAVCRTSRTGIARYTIGLVRALLARNERAGHVDEIELCYRLSRWRVRDLRLREPGVRNRWVQEPLWPLRPGVDVVHGTDARVPRWPGVARVATLHDVFSLLSDEYASETFRKRKIERYRELVERCDRILAVSAATKRDFLERFDYPAERVDVVHEGVDGRFRPVEEGARLPVLRRHGLTRPFLLYVGELTRRKNLPRLVAAFAASDAAQDLELALAGQAAFGHEEVPRAVEASGVAERVRFLGYVPDADLPALYSGAEAFLFPTSYEGFGLPVLEAMACGTPVVGADRGAVPEIAGGHAELVDPDSVDSIAAGIDRVRGRSAQAREAARAHARSFTWEACAEGTRRVYLRALGAERGVAAPAG